MGSALWVTTAPRWMEACAASRKVAALKRPISLLSLRATVCQQPSCRLSGSGAQSWTRSVWLGATSVGPA